MFLRIFVIIFVAKNVFAGHGQWMEVTIKNSCKEPIHISGALSWGKWYGNGNANHEASAPNTFIQPGKSVRVAACGRSDAASGTQGSIYIKDSERKAELVRVDFDCAWAGWSDFRAVIHDMDNVAVSHSKFDPHVGALGEMSMRVICG